ncbi:putative Lipoprotein [uncultured Mycobacterium sp.]|uniref:Putative Lipoprotein n=1 Tax=uncultured Mycobacterium sp. TaxID=171292 RepID=A0A1Y5PTJ5_9MYCO|nr:putative Lipoprotein [uncultured Mycobacterium sp.]
MRAQLAKTGAGALMALTMLAGCAVHQGTTGQAPTTQPAGYEEHNTADIAFAQQMIPIAQRAVALSDALLAKPDVDRDVADMANSVKSIDGPEIPQLQAWLNDWGNPPDAKAGDVTVLATDPSIADVTNADTATAARLFLQQMIANRQQAMELSKTESGQGEYRATVALAEANEATQKRQISTMKNLLSTR